VAHMAHGVKLEDGVVRVASGVMQLENDADGIDSIIYFLYSLFYWDGIIPHIDPRFERVSFFANMGNVSSENTDCVLVTMHALTTIIGSMSWGLRRSVTDSTVTTASRLDFHNIGLYFLHSTMIE